jgi:hypothetical protein
MSQQLWYAVKHIGGARGNMAHCWKCLINKPQGAEYVKVIIQNDGRELLKPLSHKSRAQKILLPAIDEQM